METPSHKLFQKDCIGKFLTSDWTKPDMLEKLGEKELYVTCAEKCFRITKDGHDEVQLLQTSQEEADTRMLLHAKHASTVSVVIIADDTDVLIISLEFSRDITAKLYMRCGTKNRIRYIDIKNLSTILGERECVNPSWVCTLTQAVTQ